MKKESLIGVLFLTIGILIGFFSGSNRTFHMTGQPIRADIKSLKFTNPLLFANNAKDTSQSTQNLVNQLDNYIDQAEKNSNALNVSVYFRDLNTGKWNGINESDKYAPASMLKVLAMMSVLKISETDPQIFSRRLYYKPDSSTKFYMADVRMPSGYYTVDELMSNMIVYSDNASADALMSDEEIKNTFNFVYGLFRLPEPDTKNSSEQDFMSAESYSFVFRALYNSSLFEWILSEKALDVLSKTRFGDGLVRGVPPNIMISHKFGEAGYIDNSKKVVHELHDCGIVYYPDHPYLVCIMTRGYDFYKLENILADISKSVWNFVDSQYKNN